MARSKVSNVTLLAVLFVGGVVAVLAPSYDLALADTGPGCTINSFTIPSWFIQDFRYSKASNSSSSASFRVLSRATITSVEVACGDPAGSTGWSRCSVKADKADTPTPEAFLQISGSTARLLVNETWSCGDKSPSKPYDVIFSPVQRPDFFTRIADKVPGACRIEFAAVGNSSLQLTCTVKDGKAEACKSAADTPLLIKGSLLHPVQITPAYASGPPQHDSTNCAVPSKSLSWEVGGTQYTRRTVQSKDGPSTFQSLALQVTNNVTGYTASCSGYFTSNPGPQRMSCFAQETFRPRERYHIQTEAFFDTTTLMFTVNETWFCDAGSPAAP